MTQTHTDEQAVRALFAANTAAWAAGDARAFAATFTEDAEYVTWFGRHYTGRAAIEASHAALFSSFLKGTRLDGEITRLRLLTPDVAVLDGRGAVLKGTRTRNRRNTKDYVYVAVRRANGWRFAAFHNTKYHWFFDTMAARSERGR
ncbi:SgcJ/EcaC family oxidoreductase [Nocardia sp. NPDC059177]|uniref:SgcJ/EcaC family oxidoreductase n=1 Tax=Nocardia sp. NPDC059177 TaxID=3346759 RepID=UPI003695E077